MSTAPRGILPELGEAPGIDELGLARGAVPSSHQAQFPFVRTQVLLLVSPGRVLIPAATERLATLKRTEEYNFNPVSSKCKKLHLKNPSCSRQ